MPGRTGRTPGWVKGTGPRTVGAVTHERFDESGAFEDERKAGDDHVLAVAHFQVAAYRWCRCLPLVSLVSLVSLPAACARRGTACHRGTPAWPADGRATALHPTGPTAALHAHLTPRHRHQRQAATPVTATPAAGSDTSGRQRYRRHQRTSRLGYQPVSWRQCARLSPCVRLSPCARLSPLSRFASYPSIRHNPQKD